MITVHKHRCPQNHCCPTLPVCPTGAIKQRGNAAPTIDDDECIDCGKCLLSCRAFVGDDASGLR